MKLPPDKILVKPVTPEDKTKAGIIIPTTATKRPDEGEIILVGSGTTDHPMEAKPGDHIYFSKHAGAEIELDGIKHLVMRQTDILLTL